MSRLCFSCGATPAQAVFRGTKKPAGRRDLCIDCESGEESARAERVEERRRQLAAGMLICTRAKYRARLRQRAGGPQLDLVDLLVPAP